MAGSTRSTICKNIDPEGPVQGLEHSSYIKPWRHLKESQQPRCGRITWKSAVDFLCYAPCWLRAFLMHWWTHVIEPTSDPSRYCVYFRLIIKPQTHSQEEFHGLIMAVHAAFSTVFSLLHARVPLSLQNLAPFIITSTCLQEAIPVYKGLSSKSTSLTYYQAIVPTRMNAFPVSFPCLYSLSSVQQGRRRQVHGFSSGTPNPRSFTALYNQLAACPTFVFSFPQLMESLNKLSNRVLRSSSLKTIPVL